MFRRLFNLLKPFSLKRHRDCIKDLEGMSLDFRSTTDSFRRTNEHIRKSIKLDGENGWFIRHKAHDHDT